MPRRRAAVRAGLANETGAGLASETGTVRGQDTWSWPMSVAQQTCEYAALHVEALRAGQ